MDLSIKKSTRKVEVETVAAYVEEHLRNRGEAIQAFTPGVLKAEEWDLAFMWPMDKRRELPDGTLIFSTELVALLRALWWVGEGAVG